MKYLSILLLLAGCGSPHPSSYSQNPYVYTPTCHSAVVGGICTGAMF